eukprot:s2322_g1.t1
MLRAGRFADIGGTECGCGFLAGGDLLDWTGGSFRFAKRLAAPFVVDWNGDGCQDLLVGEHDGSVRYFKGDRAGKFHFQPGARSPFHVLHPPLPRNGTFSAATELLWSVGGRIRYFLQRGKGRLVEQRGVHNPFRRIRCHWLACRFHAADWDADGDIDLAVPIGRGVAYFENRDGILTSRLGTENPFNVVLTKFTGNHRGWSGYYASVCMADWELDGDLDFLVGQTDGSVLFFERLQSGMLERRFGAQNPFHHVEGDGHYYPAVHAGVPWKDRKVRFREFNANPFSDLGNFFSAVPSTPLTAANGDTFLMFQEANVGRVSIFKKTPRGRLVNITPLDGKVPQVAFSAKWLEAGKPQDVDFNGDGEVDRPAEPNASEAVQRPPDWVLTCRPCILWSILLLQKYGGAL